MTAPHSEQIVDGYLARLDRELRDRAIPERSALLTQVESHIAEARATLHNETDAELLNILDRLGPPEAFVDGVHEAPNSAAPHGLRRHTAFTAFVIPSMLVIAWPIGLIVLLYSEAWARLERLAIAALAVLGPVLVTPYLWTHGLTWYSRIAGFFWNLATVTCLTAALILVWRSALTDPSQARWTVRFGSSVLMSVAMCLVWFALVFVLTRFLPY
jgi:HAAS